MDFIEYKKHVATISIGKKLPDAIYIHESAISSISLELASLTINILEALEIPEENWNIIKFLRKDFKISFLNYPDFETYAYPSLHHCYTVDLHKLAVRIANYSASENPPILHRKEYFVPDNYPLKGEFETITLEGEEIGLYDNPRSIGFLKNWIKLIKSKGYILDKKGLLCSIAEPSSANSETETTGEVERHKTAIDRYKLSGPMQILARHSYLNGDWSVLDYGCGKGDDIRELEAHGIDASGWDPAHNPEGELIASDIVNLGFVLNVIEDQDERKETLSRAWNYAEKLLVVSVMIAGESVINQFTPYKDGIITSRNTFQRYYAQAEIRSYIEQVLGDNAIAVGQGIFIIFKDKLEEQQFLLNRHHIQRNWRQLTEKDRRTSGRKASKDIIETHQELFDDFWESTLDLGRPPANREFEFSEQIRRVAGSHNKALTALLERYGNSLFTTSQQARKDDLLVYFALGLFEKRKPQNSLPDGLKRDIKYFFTSFNSAINEARELLFSVGKPQVIEEACVQAFNKIRCGSLIDNHSFIFHKDYLGDIPAILRIYIGCATQLYGDLEPIHLIKAHIRSGKVTLMRYSHWDSETPVLMERIKIKLRELEIDFFEYGDEYTPPPLVNKYQYHPEIET